MRGGPFIGLDCLGEFLLDPGAENLDRNLAALGRNRMMDLSDRCRPDWLLIKFAEQRFQRGFECMFDRRPDCRKWSRGKRILKLQQVFRRIRTNQVGAGRKRLTELDRSGPNLLQSGRIVGGARLGSAEPGNPAQASDIRRGQGIALNSLQRALARKRPAPLQESPQMNDGDGQIFQPPWIATRPPRIGSTLVDLNPASPIIARNASIIGKRRMDSTK